MNDRLARAIASAYGVMPHNPDDPDVKAAYAAFMTETVEQFKRIPLVVTWTKENPYTSSKDMFADVDRGRLSVFTDSDLPCDHPLVACIPGSCVVTYNDIFRAVHDYYGHYIGRYGFGPRGEENAWNAHSQMYSYAARRAMTTETRGQNCWFCANNKPGVEPKIYAPQKAGLLPSFAYEV
jgi:hypothetical protein